MFARTTVFALAFVCLGFAAHAESKDTALKQCALGAMSVNAARVPEYVEKCMDSKGYDVKWRCTISTHIPLDLDLTGSDCFKPRSWFDQQAEDLSYMTTCTGKTKTCWDTRPSLDTTQDSFGNPIIHH